MVFEKTEPSPFLAPFVECYWRAESPDTAVVEQKIVPDGCPEMIFQYRDPYWINMDGQWEKQEPFLLGGQIKKYFFLKNEGASGIFGIKFKETALAHLFGTDMSTLTDSVVGLASRLPNLAALCREIVANPDGERQVAVVEDFLKGTCRGKKADHMVDRAVAVIRNSSGSASVASLCEELAVTERSLERIFRTYVGLSPKFFARIVRFSKIFALVRQEDPSWSELAFETGYYDQSHFIRNFKAFTGEDPTRYLFATPSLANFFMNRK